MNKSRNTRRVLQLPHTVVGKNFCLQGASDILSNGNGIPPSNPIPSYCRWLSNPTTPPKWIVLIPLQQICKCTFRWRSPHTLLIDGKRVDISTNLRSAVSVHNPIPKDPSACLFRFFGKCKKCCLCVAMLSPFTPCHSADNSRSCCQNNLFNSLATGWLRVHVN